MAPYKIGQAYYSQPPIIEAKQKMATSQSENGSVANQIKGNHSPFARHLQQAIQVPGLKFSGHAQSRLTERDIQLSEEQMQRLSTGVRKAQEKGARESLILMENLAFVVSVKNQTVITAMEKPAMTEQVITNIDSTVLL